MRGEKWDADKQAMVPAEAGLVCSEDDLRKLRSVQAVVIGGMESWQTKMRHRIPHFIYLHGDAEGFDEALIVNSDIIFADVRFKFNHSCYYKLAGIVRRHKKKLVFLSRTNTSLVIRQMAGALDGSFAEQATG